MRRVLPRDAFNDANLLKCIGQLTMAIEDGLCDFLMYHYDQDPFCIVQQEYDGSTYVANVEFWAVDCKGIKNRLRFYRPMNSREAWPLVLELDGHEGEELTVFDATGQIILSRQQLEAL